MGVNIPLTPTLSLGGERENRVKNDHIEPRLVKWLEETFYEVIKVTMVAPHPPAVSSAPLKEETKSNRLSRECTIFR